MNVGFTGTAKGATEEQVISLRMVLAVIKDGDDHGIELHHGASPVEVCADWQAEAVATELGIAVVHWPPDDPSPKAMLARNQRVVDAVELLIACPRSHSELRRSGTWATVRRARRAGIPVIVIWPDGTVQRQEVRSPFS